MKKNPRLDFSRIKTYSIVELKRKVEVELLGKVFEPGEEFRQFLNSLPKILKAKDLLEFAGLWKKAAKTGKEILLMMGAHPIKVGLSPIIIDLVGKGFITGIAGNGAVAIHDVEMALFGRTSEEVIEGLADGSFGMAQETGEFLNNTAKFAAENDLGFGEALGMKLAEADPEFKEFSILFACHKKGLPMTIHTAIGADIVHQHPSCDGGAIGTASYYDFQIFACKVANLSVGVAINLGSAVIMPEVFLKALTVARNLGHTVENFTAANFDMIQHYRPHVNVLQRPTVTGGGKAFAFTGHHEIMWPLVAGILNSEY